MRRLSPRLVGIVLVLAAASPLCLARQTWQWAVSTALTRERVAGLLDLPDIIGDGCGPSTPTTLRLHAMPSPQGRLIGSVTLKVSNRQPDGGNCESPVLVVHRGDGAPDEELPTDESSYEIQAAVVYERSGSWFRIALQRGSAWVARDDPRDFLSYPELLTDRLAYVRQGWDGRLFQEPDTGTGRPVPSGLTRHLEDQLPIQVLHVLRINEEAWIQVRIETERCGETLAGLDPETGWMPAYQSSGRTAAWFYSRGC